MNDFTIKTVKYISLACDTEEGEPITIEFILKKLTPDDQKKIYLEVDSNKQVMVNNKKVATLQFPYTDVVLYRDNDGLNTLDGMIYSCIIKERNNE